MRRDITRRDFLNGVAMTAGAVMPGVCSQWAVRRSREKKSPDYYPPALTGLRGSHPGSFDAAHSLRDGTFWDTAGKPEDTGEAYDLIVVGGGISAWRRLISTARRQEKKRAFSSSTIMTTLGDTPSATSSASATHSG
jgi:hypothetical protein